MRAAVFTEAGEVDLVSHADPTPGMGEVVVEVAAVGICGTDLHVLHGAHGRRPVIPGHEFSGVVVGVGVGATLPVGARVVVDPNLPCRACTQCRRGRGNLCERLDAIGINRPGAMAEYVAVPAANCVALPDGVDLAAATLVEPLSCAVRGYDVLRMQLADRVLIYGAGTMGLIMLALAGKAGAATVHVVETNTERLQRARAHGCTNAASSAAELDDGRGWDVVIDATGNTGAIQDALTRVARGGTYLQFGVAAPEASVTLSPYRVYRDEITVTGSMAVLNSFERAADLFAAGALDPAAFITAREPLDRIADALDAFAAGFGVKTQILPGSR